MKGEGSLQEGRGEKGRSSGKTPAERTACLGKEPTQPAWGRQWVSFPRHRHNQMHTPHRPSFPKLQGEGPGLTTEAGRRPVGELQ